MRQYEVIIPVRNGGQALVNSIRSVESRANAGQVLLTLSDNFSTDGNPWKKALAGFSSEGWRIISPPQSLGRVEHWTWAFDQARLPWVKPLMVGDFVEDTFWDWAAEAIAGNPEVGLLFSNNRSLDPMRAHPEADIPYSGRMDSVLYSHDDFMRDAVQCSNRIGALSRALLRTDVMRLALPFEPEFPWTADWRFCKRLMQHAPAIYTLAPLVVLDRSIPRLSTSWKGLRGSFREDWKFAAEQAALTRQPFLRSFFARAKAVGSRAGLVIGKMVLPRSVRGFLTTVTGVHRTTQVQKT